MDEWRREESCESLIDDGSELGGVFVENDWLRSNPVCVYARARFPFV